MAEYPCTFIEQTNRVKIYLSVTSRDYQNNPCPLSHEGKYWHKTRTYWQDDDLIDSSENSSWGTSKWTDVPAELWNYKCDCGYDIPINECEKALSNARIGKNVYTGELLTYDEYPIGALYEAWWNDEQWKGPDGLIIVCKMPKGEWCIDQRANNCTKPDDSEHRCWVRHGNPRDPQGRETGIPFTVDKNGNTCQAGAGSILMSNGWHGFLTNGVLRGD